jgi:hypothetical protein
MSEKVNDLFEEQKARALATVGQEVLTILKRAPNQTANVHFLIDTTGIDLETLLGILETLKKSGLIQYTSRDKFGNHQVQLVPTEENI